MAKQILRSDNGELFIDGGASICSAPVTAAVTAHALNSTFSDTEAEAALNALGTAVNSVITALEVAGILKPN